MSLIGREREKEVGLAFSFLVAVSKLESYSGAKELSVSHGKSMSMNSNTTSSSPLLAIFKTLHASPPLILGRLAVAWLLLLLVNRPLDTSFGLVGLC